MTKHILIALTVVAMLMLAACSGGGDATPEAVGDAIDLMRTAQTALDSGDYAQAVKDFQASLAKGKSLDAYFGLGNAYTRQNNFIEAEKAYQEALKINPNHTATLSNLGVALYQQGRLEEAISTFERALKNSPTDAETHYLLGAAQLQLGKMNEAEQSLLKALEINEDLPEARFGLAMLRKVQGRNEEAIAEFEAFLAGAPAQDPQAKTQAELMLKELRGQ